MFNDGLVDGLEFFGVALIRLIPKTCQHNHSKGLQFETRGNTTSTTMTWKNHDMETCTSPAFHLEIPFF